MTWLAAYPTITVILASFKPLGLMGLPLPVRTLVLTVIMVPTVAFVFAPLVSRALARWLRRCTIGSQSGEKHPQSAPRLRDS